MSHPGDGIAAALLYELLLLTWLFLVQHWMLVKRQQHSGCMCLHLIISLSPSQALVTVAAHTQSFLSFHKQL
jgi:hypothetical protein